MHVGFAVEGSVGTNMKVDALYLSPDHQVALRVESLNEKYGTQILFTEALYDLLSDKGQSSVRQIDQVLIKESLSGQKQIWSYDIKPIAPLHEDDEDEEEDHNRLAEEKPPREIGIFIKHEDFIDNGLNDNEEQIKQFEALPMLEQVFLMDHDLLCIQRQRDEEFEGLYEKGLSAYMQGDWIGAQQSYNSALEKCTWSDGPLTYMLRLIEKAKGIAPEEWVGAFDWDFKPVPPEVEFVDEESEEMSGA